MNDLTSKYVRPGLTHNPNLTFLRNEIGKYRYLCLPGGTRSGKTYSVVQFLWSQMAKYTGVKYSVARATLTALKATVLEDFIEIGRDANLYAIEKHNQSSNVYRHNGNMLDYFGLDGDEKPRGRKRDVLYMNEAPEMTWKDVKQLQFRTSSTIIIDYNPSYPESWVYDNILTRSDCAYITTTFKDNPHLSKGQLEELEWMRINDPEGYIVYGLGQRGELKGQVYKNWKEIKELPEDLPSVYVIDFGFTNDPTVISQFKRDKKAVYGKELVYATGLHNIDIAIHMFFKGIGRSDVIIAESAEPKSISELRQGWALEADYIMTQCIKLGYHPDAIQMIALKKQLKDGWLVLNAVKGPDSINNGIQRIKQNEVFITKDSENAWREYRRYRWAEDKKTGELLNMPIDEYNHFMDTARYYELGRGRYY